ncbi:MAG: ASPIC/UnbV domain-containing protein [Isosphaeraceae bacterium]
MGDLDNNGRLDVVIVDQKGPLAVLQNRPNGPRAGRFVVIELEGTRSNRDAMGTMIKVNAGSQRLVRVCSGGGSYQSASDRRIHLGLGAAERIDALEIRWPSGLSERFRDLAVDRGYLIREGGGAIAPLPGFEPGSDAARGVPGTSKTR